MKLSFNFFFIYLYFFFVLDNPCFDICTVQVGKFMFFLNLLSKKYLMNGLDQVTLIIITLKTIYDNFAVITVAIYIFQMK